MRMDKPKGLEADVYSWYMERANKRLFILCIILLIGLFGTFTLWMLREQEFAKEVITIEADQEADGLGRNYVIGGDYEYGYETESENN